MKAGRFRWPSFWWCRWLSGRGAGHKLQLLPDPPGQKLAYLGLPIRRYRLQDGRILYACQAYGLTLCAFAREALAHCLDQAMLHMISDIQAAHGEKTWLTRHRRLPNKAGEFFCYANIAGLRVQPLWASALEPDFVSVADVHIEPMGTL